jgi:hypothetical protein
MTTLRMPHHRLVPDDEKTLVMARPASCLNCRTILAGEFCHSCGQARKTPSKVTFLGILTDIPRSIWDLDKSLPYTLVALLRRPGHTAREYLEGRRAKIYSPTALLFLISSFAILVAVTLKVRSIDGNVSGDIDLFGRKLNAAQLALDYYAWITMASVPIMALGPLVALRRRMHYGYGEQIIAGMLIMAGASALGTLGTPIEWAAKGTKAAAAVSYSLEAAKWLYQIWAYAQLQDDPKHTRSALSRWAYAVLSFLGSVVAIVGIFAVVITIAVVVAVLVKQRHL